jgi:hypothetical protein
LTALWSQCLLILQEKRRLQQQQEREEKEMIRIAREKKKEKVRLTVLPGVTVADATSQCQRAQDDRMASYRGAIRHQGSKLDPSTGLWKSEALKSLC